MEAIIARALAEGISLEDQLREYALSLREPLSSALSQLIEGGSVEEILRTLRSFLRSEIEVESRELDQKLGLRMATCFLIMMLMVSAAAVGSIPPWLIGPLCYAISAVIVLYLIRRSGLG